MEGVPTCLIVVGVLIGVNSAEIDHITKKEDLTSDELCYLNDKSKCEIIDIIRRTVASFALIGCLFIIGTHMLLGLYKQFANRLILYLTLCGTAHSVAYLANDLRSHGHACNSLGWLLYYTDLSTLFWVCCITINNYMNAVKLKQTVQHELKYHILSWGLPLVISLIPVIADTYGPAGVWCWITDGEGWRFGMWYGPLVFIILVLFIVYPYIIWKVYTLGKKAELGQLDPIMQRKMVWLMNDVKPLIAYPLVYLLVSIFPLVNRVQNAISPEPVFALVVLHALFSPLQSGLNAIVYALSKDVLSQLRPSQLKIILETKFRKKECLVDNEQNAPVPVSSLSMSVL